MTTPPGRTLRPPTRAVGRGLVRAVVSVVPPVTRAVEERLLAGVHAPLLAEPVRRRLARAPGDVAIRYLAFAVKRGRVNALAPEPAGGRVLPQLARWRDSLLDRALARLAHRAQARQQIPALYELAALESAVLQGTMDETRLERLLDLAPTEVRLVRERTGGIGEALRRALEPAEVLAYVADDLTRYGAADDVNRSLLYTAYVQVHGGAAPERLQEAVELLCRRLAEGLAGLPPDERARFEAVCPPTLAPTTEEYPAPTPGRAPQLSVGVSGAVVLFGILCVVGWLVAYAGIISRGFADATYGVPLPALVANLSWEFAYGFLLDPFGDYFHTSSIFGFLVDLVIGWQAWRYGAADFAGTPIGRHFRAFLLGALALAFPVTYLAFGELRDPDGEYTGFGINLMMSVLYLVMLQRRDGPAGQSMYIAVGKWVGTLCAWIATVLTVTTSPDRTWPTGGRQLVRAVLTNRSYPLTPLINVMYAWTFVLDALYSVLLYRRLRRAGISPWRRF